MVPFVTRIMPTSEYYVLSVLSKLRFFAFAIAIMRMYDETYRFFQKDDDNYIEMYVHQL